jgi:hypothetical protein
MIDRPTKHSEDIVEQSLILQKKTDAEISCQ